MRASNQLRPLLACAAALCFASVIAATPASATVSVNIDLTAQRMHVEGAGDNNMTGRFRALATAT